uniref:TIMELESS-interacting protein n=1 Tax=Pundamilia nyererei TaxID=303518 RepID=A0A3B4EWP6_9CICH
MVDPQENSPQDIPDYDGIEDEAFPPLPPPHSPGRGGQEEGDPFLPFLSWSKMSEGNQRLVYQIKMSFVPMTGSHFLVGRRSVLSHTAADLRLLMQKMENWAHRLYPKLQFEDFIDKVERLGSKKEVQTCLKRIRLDMPLTHEDFTSTDEVQRELETFGNPDLFSRESFINAPQGQIAEALAPPPTPSLTEEQQKRIELNRQRALEKRLARQQQIGKNEAKINGVFLCNYKLCVNSLGIKIKLTLVSCHQRAKYYCRCYYVKVTGT